MNERIKKIESRLFGGRHKPTSTNLIIDIDYSGNIEIFRENSVVKNSLFASTFDLFFFDIGEFPVEMTFNDFRTHIGAAVNGTLKFAISVKDEDDKIRKAFGERENQMNNLKNKINASVQTFISRIEKIDVRTAAIGLREFLNTTKDEISYYSCYSIVNFNSCILDLANINERIILDEIVSNELIKEKTKINNTRELTDILHNLQIDGHKRKYDNDTKELLRQLFMKERGLESHNPEKAMDYDLEKRKIEGLIENDHIQLIEKLVEMSNRQNNTAEIIAMIKGVVDKLTLFFLKN